VAATSKTLQSELSRVQDLLGSVLKKCPIVGSSGEPAASRSDAEVENLRAQTASASGRLQRLFRTTNSTFLRKELKERTVFCTPYQQAMIPVQLTSILIDVSMHFYLRYFTDKYLQVRDQASLQHQHRRPETLVGQAL